MYETGAVTAIPKKVNTYFFDDISFMFEMLFKIQHSSIYFFIFILIISQFTFFDDLFTNLYCKEVK